MAKAVSSINEENYIGEKCWGLSASIDLYGCDPRMIKTPKEIKRFVAELCDEIKMKRHGDVLLDRFGDGVLVSEGYSFMQFIETSSITAHFDEPQNKAFIDIFSCKYFVPKIAADFCKKFFKAESCEVNVLLRK
ncbi:MAG TPA: S-adenosylmethionine decarboxylase [Candidatus Moranbacteria bacterium]|nr:S-adenosylmethionine decarboxylase [Candidatus Moranbacteria bacterium]HAT74925.1 S-adenosylmethionine decarboxylase [Candidatus Moranbacteria bacterium]